MRFEPTNLSEVLIVRQEIKSDARGFFSRIYCESEFQAAGVNFSPKQLNRSFSTQKFTLRGMHYQIKESAEAKYIRVLSGSIWDVAVDVRPESDTYLKSIGLELTSETPYGIFIPEGFAHGMLTTSKNTEIEYLVSAAYSPEHERGLRFDDPSLNIYWPAAPECISEKDSKWEWL